MALFVGESVGIDLGTTYSCVGVWQNERVEIIANDQGNRTTPSYVAFSNEERLIGDAAKHQVAMNVTNTVFDAKRLIGRSFSDPTVASDKKHWPFTVVQGPGGKPTITVYFKGQRKQFTPEEISSMVLAKMKETAETYLGKEVSAIPPELGDLRELRELWLNKNQLTGAIPPELGNLEALQTLILGWNRLSGRVPSELGKLGALEYLSLANNELSGPVPSELGKLGALEYLYLESNQLSGNVPPQLGQLGHLKFLDLAGNKLDGNVPPQLGQLGDLRELDLAGNKLDGGPREGESLRSWKSRLQAELVERKPVERERAQQGRDEEHARLEQAGTIAGTAGPTSSSSGREQQQLFREQVASFAELDELTRKNHESLLEITRLMAKTAAGSLSSELTDADKLRELDRLLAMAKTLGDMASQHMQDEELQRKEMSLGPAPDAYFDAVRSGLLAGDLGSNTSARC
eukprot:g14320.t2